METRRPFGRGIHVRPHQRMSESRLTLAGSSSANTRDERIAGPEQPVISKDPSGGAGRHLRAKSGASRRSLAHSQGTDTTAPILAMYFLHSAADRGFSPLSLRLDAGADFIFPLRGSDVPTVRDCWFPSATWMTP